MSDTTFKRLVNIIKRKKGSKMETIRTRQIESAEGLFVILKRIGAKIGITALFLVLASCSSSDSITKTSKVVEDAPQAIGPITNVAFGTFIYSTGAIGWVKINSYSDEFNVYSVTVRINGSQQVTGNFSSGEIRKITDDMDFDGAHWSTDGKDAFSNY